MNDQLGGIDRQAVKLDTGPTANAPASSQSCSQQSDPLDLTAAYRHYEALEAALASPRHRAMVRNARLHLKAQILGRADDLRSLLSPDFYFRTYGSTLAQGMEVRGIDQAMVHYEGMVDAGLGLIEITLHDVTVSDHSLGNRAVCRYIVAGGAPLGVPPALAKEIVDPGADYLVTYNAAWFLVFDEADPPRAIAEHMFVDDFSMSLTRLGPGRQMSRVTLPVDLFDIQGSET